MKKKSTSLDPLLSSQPSVEKPTSQELVVAKIKLKEIVLMISPLLSVVRETITEKIDKKETETEKDKTLISAVVVE